MNGFTVFMWFENDKKISSNTNLIHESREVGQVNTSDGVIPRVWMQAVLRTAFSLVATVLTNVKHVKG